MLKFVSKFIQDSSDRRLYDKATAKIGKQQKAAQTAAASFSPAIGSSDVTDHIGMNTRFLKKSRKK